MSINNVWEELFKSKAWGKYPSEDLIRFIARNFYAVPNRKEIKILEIGSGTGANVWYLLNEGFTVYAVEGSSTGIELMKSRIQKDANLDIHNLHAVQGDIEKLPFESNFFDAVIDIQAIYSNDWKKSKNIIQEVARVLKDDGKFYSRHFAINSSGYGTGEKIENNTYIPTEGVLVGTGQARFASKDDVYQLYGDYFNLNELEQGIRTVDNLENKVIEWHISMIKKGD